MDAKAYKTIYEDMRNYVIAHQDKLTDFNAGSVISSILEALAREVAALYLKAMSNVNTYSKNIAYAQFNFEKKSGLAASGYVVFARDVASASEVAIPASTQVETSSGVAFITAAEVKIASGAKESSAVMVTSTAVGADGNVGISKIDTISGTLLGVDSVRNDAAFTGGVDEETDEEYHNRFQDYIDGLGKSSVPGIRSTALGINGIKSVKVLEHFPPEDGYNFTVFAEDGSGYLPSALKTAIQTALDGDEETEGARACGLNCRTLAPSIINVNPSIVIRINWNIPKGLIESEITTKLTKYINGLNIGTAYDKKVVYNMLMNQSGVLEVVSMTPDTTTPTDRQIIRMGTLSLESV
jgi:uncharacterized phage protein gp47/JayE